MSDIFSAWGKAFEGSGGAERLERAMPTYNPPHSYGWGPAMRHDPIENALHEAGYSGTNREIRAADRAFTGAYSGVGSSPTPSMYPSYSSSGGGGGYGYGGGYGGGGGGGGPTGITQAQLDWISKLLGQGEPDPERAERLRLPAYRSRFHPQMYNQLMNRFNTAVGIDQRRAAQAYNNLGQFAKRNYTNAFTGPNARFATMAKAPGMDARQMARLMQGQGLNPSIAAAQMQGAGAADQGFRNLWSVLGANEDLAQRNRLANIGEDRATTANALRVAALQGRTGIGLQKAGAKDEWRTRVEEARNQLRQQQALANWQRRNQVTDTNLTNTTSFRNNLISAIIGLVPNLAEGVELPEIGGLLGNAPPVRKGGRKGKGGGEEEPTPAQSRRRHLHYRRTQGKGKG